MKTNLDEIHVEVADIKAADGDGITRISLRDIPEIDDKDWPSLKAKLLAGTIKVQEMATSPISFALLAAPSDRAAFRFFNALAFIVPAAGILLGLVFSWWFLLLAPGFFVPLNTAKGVYRTVIFQGVTASEAVFCFLFSRNTICLQQDGAVVYRKNE